MKVFSFLLLIALARAQINVETVCRYVVNALDCSTFDYKLLCATGGVQFSTECDFTKAHCQDSSLKVVNEGPCSSTSATAPAASTVTSVPDSTAMVPDSTPAADTTPIADTTPVMVTTAGVPDTTVTGGLVTATIPPDVTMPPTAADTTMEQTTMMMTTADMGTTTDPNLSDVCNQIVNTPCAAGDDNPLCATNGITYLNYCEYSKARCYFPTLHLAYSGQCSSTDTFPSFTTPGRTTQPPSVFDIICRTLQQVTCENDGIQVCGTDGMTYDTACDFEKAKCMDPTLTVHNC